MMAMATDRPFAERLMDRITDIYIESVDRYLEQVGEYIDVFTYWDDVSTQDGWMIGPETYAALVKPRQKRLFDAIKRRTNAKLFYHCCGAASELYPHLVADLLRRPEREDPLGVHAAAPEDEVAPEALLELLRVHTASADLDRIDDVHPDLDEVRRR